MKVLKVNPLMSKEKADGFIGTLLTDKDYQTLIDYDCDVYCAETGNLLAKFRRKVIPIDMIKYSYKSFQEAATVTTNRTAASGQEGSYRINEDGTKGKTRVTPGVNSGIIGYFDRTMRFPYCRMTSFTSQKFEKWNKCLPIVKRVNDLYKELIPEKWEIQKNYCEKTSPDFVIKDTVFTTVTVNKNFQTAVHTDKGDLQEGFGNLVALRKGRYVGGYFVLVRWGVAFNLQNGDVLFTDVHQPHGNTPIRKLEPDAERISLVIYYRENMINCGSAEEEVYVAKRRESLTGLNKKDKSV